MGKSVHNLIISEYEKKQKKAFDDLMSRKEEVYSRVPEIQEIDAEIQRAGIKYNKMILQGSTSSEETVAELFLKIDELKKKKQQLLVKSGYPANYLEIVYECPLCKDTGFIENGSGAEKCACYKQLLINCLYSQSNLMLTEMGNFSLFNENYYPDVVDEGRYGIKVSPREYILKIKERCLKFIENFNLPEEKNLFFSGPTGVGKTFMSNCIAAELLNRGRTVLYQTAPKLFDVINEYKMRSIKDEDFEDTYYKDIFDVELLIIDDLGTEPPSAARFASLLNILNIRQMNNLSRPCKTIISTNIGARELYEYYDERVASRIIGCFDILRFAGEDIRRIKKLGGR